MNGLVGTKPRTKTKIWPLVLFIHFNVGKSAASFCHQVATLVPDMFCSFYLVKNHKIANNSETTEAR